MNPGTVIRVVGAALIAVGLVLLFATGAVASALGAQGGAVAVAGASDPSSLAFWFQLSFSGFLARRSWEWASSCVVPGTAGRRTTAILAQADGGRARRRGGDGRGTANRRLDLDCRVGAGGGLAFSRHRVFVELMAPFKRAFCLSADERECGRGGGDRIARREQPMKGCNANPFSRMRRIHGGRPG